MNLDTLYQLMMMKPADCIPKIKSLSKIQMLKRQSSIGLLWAKTCIESLSDNLQ
jgi:hypothetical protein